MSRDTFLNLIAVALLAVCFVIALGTVFFREVKKNDPDEITIRISHWQLEDGIRTAFDELIRQYEEIYHKRTGKRVKVEQLPIPERIYPNWLITKLVGGEAPDLIELGFGRTTDRIARYFVPLTPYISEPNPYNVGTPLEGVPWRDTFLDGLQTHATYDQDLQDYYGVGLNIHTARVYYNESLLKEIAGPDAKAPETFDEFIELCEETLAFSERTGRKIVPVAGSKYNSPYLMDKLLHSQTQRLRRDLDRMLELRPANEEISLGYLEGEWTMDDGGMQSALSLVSSVGKYMTPGFMQLQREDATFNFLQGKALMILTGSWDVKSLTAQAPFPVGVFQFPMPERDHPKYGPYALGAMSEAAAGTGTPFGLSRQSKHPEVAVDFLRFISSYHGNKVFSDISYWLPAVTGVEIPEPVRAFAPLADGFEGGVYLSHLGEDTKTLFAQNMYRLFLKDDPVENFTQKMKADLPTTLVKDLERNTKNMSRNNMRADSPVSALLWMDVTADDNPEIDRKLMEITVKQTRSEIMVLDALERLKRIQADPSSVPR